MVNILCQNFFSPFAGQIIYFLYSESTYLFTKKNIKSIFNKALYRHNINNMNKHNLLLRVFFNDLDKSPCTVDINQINLAIHNDE